jgi:hypothetical protein
MSLVTKPLDYSSATSKATIEGIRGNIQAQQQNMALLQQEKKRRDQIVSRIEGQFASMQGNMMNLDDESKRVFQEGFMKAYETELENWSNDPSQDNLNRLNVIVAQGKQFLDVARGGYTSDNQTLIRSQANSSNFQETPDQMQERFDNKWGTLDDVRYNEETMQVEIIDSQNGVSNYSSVFSGRYKPSQETALVFSPVDSYRFETPQAFGARTGRAFISAGKMSEFGDFFDLQVQADPKGLGRSVVESYAANHEMSPEEVRSNPKLLELAKEEYLEISNGTMVGMKAEDDRRRAEAVSRSRTNKFSGTYTQTLDGTNYEMKQLASPMTLKIEGAEVNGSRPIETVRVTGFYHKAGTLVVDLQEKTTQITDMSGMPLSPNSEEYKEAIQDIQTNNSNNRGISYQVKTEERGVTKQITDVDEFDSYIRQLGNLVK